MVGSVWCSAEVMGKKHDRRPRDEWKSWVEKWRVSGLDRKAFARKHGLSYSGLFRWSQIFGEKSGAALGFTEVRVRETNPSPRPPSSADTIEIVTRSGWVVRVTGAVDVERLREVLEVVGSC